MSVKTIKIVKADFTSPVLGNVWVGRIAKLPVSTADALIKQGKAVEVAADEVETPIDTGAGSDDNKETPAGESLDDGQAGGADEKKLDDDSKKESPKPADEDKKPDQKRTHGSKSSKK